MANHFLAVSTARNVIAALVRQPKGDFCERLASVYTVAILALLSALLITSHYWGEPIDCWSPAEYKGKWDKFVDDYCYVHGTYYVPLNRPLPWDANERHQIPITYYQWVPYVFGVQAFLFYMPRFLWKRMCSMFGLDMVDLLRHIDQVWRDGVAHGDQLELRVRRFETHAAPLVWDALRLLRRQARGIPSTFLCFVLVKVVHAVNACAQWYYLNSFLASPHYEYWGLGILRDLRSGVDWQATGHFPRLTHCDFFRRKTSAVNMETVTCVLTLNIYYEKIFIFLWFWLVFVSFLCIISAFYWLLLFCFASANEAHVRRLLTATSPHLEVPEKIVAHRQSETVAGISGAASTAPLTGSKAASESSVEKAASAQQEIDASKTLAAKIFLHRHLQTDGIFFLRLAAINLGDLPAAYLVRALYNTAISGAGWRPVVHSPEPGRYLAHRLLKGSKEV